ncbi:hypothetical protein HPGCJGGD_0855 [Methylobacterium haplocladii]|nr:hypothetical protein HPGCJGGD_0855 [Methylobacterium haplocladii]
MRKNLIATLILACVASGCVSPNARGPSSGLGSGLNVDPARPKSCYGGPVYVPC